MNVPIIRPDLAEVNDIIDSKRGKAIRQADINASMDIVAVLYAIQLIDRLMKGNRDHILIGNCNGKYYDQGKTLRIDLENRTFHCDCKKSFGVKYSKSEGDIIDLLTHIEDSTVGTSSSRAIAYASIVMSDWRMPANRERGDKILRSGHRRKLTFSEAQQMAQEGSISPSAWVCVRKSEMKFLARLTDNIVKP